MRLCEAAIKAIRGMTVAVAVAEAYQKAGTCPLTWVPSPRFQLSRPFLYGIIARRTRTLEA